MQQILGISGDRTSLWFSFSHGESSLSLPLGVMLTGACQMEPQNMLVTKVNDTAGSRSQCVFWNTFVLERLALQTAQACIVSVQCLSSLMMHNGGHCEMPGAGSF